MARKKGYRKLALKTYHPSCAYCGFGITAVLEIAHIDRDHTNDKIDNLVPLCPTCHRMYDLDLIPTEHIRVMRDRSKAANWNTLLGDGPKKAAETLKAKKLKQKYFAAAKRAALTRKRKVAAKKAVATRAANRKNAKNNEAEGE